jgi:hypothetical protein
VLSSVKFIIFFILQKADVGVRLKLEICRALAAISNYKFELLLSDNGFTLQVTSNLLVKTIYEEDIDVQLQTTAGRSLFDLGTSLSKYLQEPGIFIR